MSKPLKNALAGIREKREVKEETSKLGTLSALLALSLGYDLLHGIQPYHLRIATYEREVVPLIGRLFDIIELLNDRGPPRI